MDNPIVWAIAHAMLAVALTVILIVRPGYWAGSMSFVHSVWAMMHAAVRGKVAPKGARTRWQFTCLACGATAAAFTAICSWAMAANLPHAAWLVGAGRSWLMLVLFAFALGALSTGREAHAG
jgi:hypothetical protein